MLPSQSTHRLDATACVESKWSEAAVTQGLRSLLDDITEMQLHAFVFALSRRLNLHEGDERTPETTSWISFKKIGRALSLL